MTKIRYAARNPALKWSLWLIDHALSLLPRRRCGPDETKPVRRVLVCMQAHLGDVILATAVIPSLQKHFPEARLGLLVHPASVQVVEGHSAVAWVHTFEHWRLNRRDRSWAKRLWRHWKSARACQESVRAVGYDLAIDLYHHFPNSVPLVHRCGVDRIVGWSSAGYSPWLDEVAHDEGQPLNILERHARLLRLADIEVDTSPLNPVIEVSKEGAAQWHEIARSRGLTRPAVIFHVGAHASYKQWPSQRWAEAAERVSAGGHSLVLLGQSAAEVAICKEIAVKCPLATDLSGHLTWGALVAAIASCRLLVAHDSAAIHLAAAFGKARICITTGIMDPRIWLTAAPSSVVLVHPMPCSPCRRLSGCNTMGCIRGVTSGSVVSAVHRFVGTVRAEQ